MNKRIYLCTGCLDKLEDQGKLSSYYRTNLLHLCSAKGCFNLSDFTAFVKNNVQVV